LFSLTLVSLVFLTSLYSLSCFECKRNY
jgi:hypothetical protein